MDRLKEKFVTLLTVTHPSEMYVIRGKLESEGIECFAQDELLDVSRVWSGVRLQILEGDLEKALEILRQNGYPDFKE